jgi:hypothetical protein
MSIWTGGSEAAAATGPRQRASVPTADGPEVSARWRLLAGAAGFVGAAALGAAWLEGAGTALYVIFVLALVHLAGARAGLAGRITTLAAAVVLAVSLIYDLTLIAIAQSAALGGRQATTALVAYGFFAAAEHLFLLAPPLFLPLGLILVRTPVLPRPFAILAVIFGVIAPLLGLAGLFTVTANNNGPVGAAINALVAAEGFWIIAASVTLPLRAGPAGGQPRQRNTATAAT